jgi:hypothetical protein
MEIDDASRFTPSIKTVLDLFNNHNAQAVFILNEEKIIHFKIFTRKFLALTKDDEHIYDFVGTNPKFKPAKMRTKRFLYR